MMNNRNAMGKLYTKLIKENNIDVQPPVILPQNKSVYAQYTLLVKDRASIATKLKENGIPTAIYYPKCLHEQPVYKYLGYKLEDFPNSVKASREVLSLPMHGWITEEDVRTVVDVLKLC